VTAWGLDIHVQGSQGRDYSVAQLIDNLASIPGGGSTGGQLSATVEFRNDLWSGTLNLARDQGALVTGLGFGPNLAAELGLQGQANDPLRSPHNSHVDVLARMGFVGAALWLLLWMSWYSAVLRRLIGTPGSLSQVSGGVLKVCLVGVTAILVNAYFDPTLESPQAALWLWTLVGLGVALAAPHRAGPHRAAPR
jgi:O-antigen ligase